MATIRGNGRDNVLTGTNFDDLILGRKGDDDLFGLDGNDTLNGGRGNDDLWGGDGNDLLNGGRGNDSLWGGNGDDIMNGGNGNDIIYADGGNDIATGGAGADVFVFAPNMAVMTITDFENGVDLMDVSAFGFDLNGQSPNYAGYLESHNADTHVVFYDISGEVARIILEDFSHVDIDPSDYVL